MGWQFDEVWLEADVLWFREQPRLPFVRVARAVPALAELPLFHPSESGLEASRQRRRTKESDRRRRRVTRTMPAVALVVGSTSMLSFSALRNGNGAVSAGLLTEDPPSLSFGLDLKRLAGKPKPVTRELARANALSEIEWHRATSAGRPYAGRLGGGTQLPVTGPDWATWDPVTDRVPNLAHRLYGIERTIRAIVSVASAYREAHPNAPKVVIGDISLRGGGRMDEHLSHQNGRDVDVYYPRRDSHLSAPIATSQIDRLLAQDLLDRFVAAGAEIVFVGYATGLRGADGVVVPYPNHENHMHVRFPAPG